MKYNFLITAFLYLILYQSCASNDENTTQNAIGSTAIKPDTLLPHTDSAKSGGYTIIVEKIDSLLFNIAKQKTKIRNKNLTKITDLKEVAKLLKGIVDFSQDEGSEYQSVLKINFRNGKKYENLNDYDYNYFVAYYPEEEILLCEGGHSMDVSFNLENGEETALTGNPDLFIFSPSDSFRINGSYDGQECLGYFIQKKINGAYRTVIRFEEEFKAQTKINLCNIREGFWRDEQTIFLEKFDYDFETGKYKYFKVTIIEH